MKRLFCLLAIVAQEDKSVYGEIAGLVVSTNQNQGAGKSQERKSRETQL